MGPDAVGGMVVVLEGEVEPSLRRVAKERSLAILEAEAAEQALQHIRSARPRVIIVQVGQEKKEALKLIRLATTASRQVPLIAAATRHTTKLEREVRHAGAAYYIPGIAPGLLEPILEAVSAQEKRG